MVPLKLAISLLMIYKTISATRKADIEVFVKCSIFGCFLIKRYKKRRMSNWHTSFLYLLTFLRNSINFDTAIDIVLIGWWIRISTRAVIDVEIPLN